MRWTHLSDIHFGYENASVDTMRKKLLEKARSFEHIDCLFITGDLRYGKNAPSEYPQETLDFLLELRSALNLRPNDIYIVPGNHDLERSSSLTSIINGVSQQYSTPNGHIDRDALDYIASRRNACYNRNYLDYVCVDNMGTLLSPNYLSATFPKLLEKNGMRHIRFHDLRHSCASLLLANDVPMKQIQEWLGHSDFSTTANIYAHLDYKSKLASADAMMNGLSNALEVFA